MKSNRKDKVASLVETLIKLEVKYSAEFREKIKQSSVNEREIKEITLAFCNARIELNHPSTYQAAYDYYASNNNYFSSSYSEYSSEEFKEIYKFLKSQEHEQEALHKTKCVLIENNLHHLNGLQYLNHYGSTDSIVKFFSEQNDIDGLNILVDKILLRGDEGHLMEHSDVPHEFVAFPIAKKISYRVDDLRNRLKKKATTKFLSRGIIAGNYYQYTERILWLCEKEQETKLAGEIGDIFFDAGEMKRASEFYKISGNDELIIKIKETRLKSKPIWELKNLFKAPGEKEKLINLVIMKDPDLEDYSDIIKKFV